MAGPWEKYQDQPPSGRPWEKHQTGWDVARDEAAGAIKGAGQGLVGVLSQVPGLGTPSVNELDPRVKQFAEEPSQNVGQTAGKVVGGALPFMVGGPEAVVGRGAAEAIPFAGRFAGPIGEMIGRMTVGGGSAAAQPPEPGQTRLGNAAAGTVGGGAMSPKIIGPISGVAGGAGAGLGLEQLIRQFGWEPVAGAIMGGLGYGGLHGGLYSLARRASALASYPGKVIANYTPSALAGVAAAAGKQKAQDMMKPQVQQSIENSQ